jgi:MIP family channel proteins
MLTKILHPIPLCNVLAEFLGMFLFTFFGGGCDANSVSTGLPTAAIGNGLCLAVLVYATAGISGGHLNPAVSTAFFVTGRLGRQRYLLYVAAQFLGASLGAAVLRLSLPPSYLETPFITAGSLTAAHPVQVFMLEFTCTFVLVYVIFATAVDKSGSAKNAAPLCIGLAVVAGVFAEGPFSGGSMNPARSVGAAVAFWKFNHLLIYLFATVSGACAAGLTYDKIFLEDVQPAEIEDRDEGEYEPSA